MFLVLPSQCYETFARVAMEAFAKGTPVIVSKLGAMVDDGRTGLHFKPGDPPISPRKCGKFWQTRSGWRECGKQHVRNSTGTSPRKPTTRVSWRSTSKLSVGATKLSAPPYQSGPVFHKEPPMLLNATRSLPLSGKAAPFKISRDEIAEVLFGSTDTIGHLICVNAFLYECVARAQCRLHRFCDGRRPDVAAAICATRAQPTGYLNPTEALVPPRDTSHHQVAANRCKLTRPRQSARPKVDRNSTLSHITSTSQALGRVIRMDYPPCNLFIIPDRGSFCRLG